MTRSRHVQGFHVQMPYWPPKLRVALTAIVSQDQCVSGARSGILTVPRVIAFLCRANPDVVSVTVTVSLVLFLYGSCYLAY